MSDTDPKYFDDEDDQVPDTYRDGSEGMYLGDGVYVSNDFFDPDPEELNARRKKSELARQERVRDENETIEEILKVGIVDTNKEAFSWPKARVSVHRSLCHERYGLKCGHSYVLEAHESFKYEMNPDYREYERNRLSDIFLRRSVVRKDREERSVGDAVTADRAELADLPYSIDLYQETLVKISFGDGSGTSLTVGTDDPIKIYNSSGSQFISNLVQTLNILNEARGEELIADSPSSIAKAIDSTVKNFKTTNSIIFLLKACVGHTRDVVDGPLLRLQERLRNTFHKDSLRHISLTVADLAAELGVVPNSILKFCREENERLDWQERFHLKSKDCIVQSGNQKTADRIRPYFTGITLYSMSAELNISIDEATNNLRQLGAGIYTPNNLYRRVPKWLADDIPSDKAHSECPDHLRQARKIEGYRCVAWGDNEHGTCDVPLGLFTEVSTTVDHCIGMREDGSIECWGLNDDGQCDAPGGVFTQVSAGDGHSIGLRRDGTIECWGNNEYGQCNAPEGFFTHISASGRASVGIRADGEIVCWGYSNLQQLNAPKGRFTQVAGGGCHCVAIRDDGTVLVWGRTIDGQGDVPTGQFIDVAAGDVHCIALAVDGSVKCWGHVGHDDEELEYVGHVDAEKNPEPNSTYIQISGGVNHAIALRDDGTISSWGNNDDGQCNPPEGTYKHVAAGRCFTVALVDD